MIQEKINSVRTRLSELGGQVSPEHWEIIRRATAELDDAAASARRLEAATLPPAVFICCPLPSTN